MISKINFKAPLSVEILITSKCNYNCVHCIFDSGSRRNENLSKEQILNLVDRLAEMEVFTIGLNGGEALLRKSDLYEIIARIRQKRMNFILTTNGLLLDKEFIKFVSDKGISCVRISLPHSNKEAYEQFCRVPGTFEKVLKNISLCVKQGLQTVLLVPLYQGNLKEIDLTIRLGKSLGVTAFNFFPIIPMGRAKKLMDSKGMLFTKKNYKSFLKLIMKKQTMVAEPKIFGDFPLEILVNKKSQKESSDWLAKVCPAGITTCVIDWSGEVYPCPFFPKSMGNVFKEDIRAIWKNNSFMNKLRTISRFKGSKCEKCKYLQVCRGGCPARTCSMRGTISEEDPLCWL